MIDLPLAATPWLTDLYSATRGGSLLWTLYAAAALVLLGAMAWPARRLRWTALGLFALATALSAAAFGVRWWLSGRPWYLPPLMNQFEAVMGSVLLGSIVALSLERSNVQPRGLFAFAAALWGVAAMLFCFLLPQKAGLGISPPPGILRTPLMAVHVSTIIIGHALAGMAAVVSAAYLLRGLVRPPRSDEPSSAPADLAAPAPAGMLASIDRANLIVVQLAVFMISLGTVLGALWGDVAWGRWWGWDIKETWALINAAVYVLILHLRFVMPPRWRGLATAIGCVVGAAVMLFNWLAVNYLFTGLHSYA